MKESPKDPLKVMFDKVNSEDAFARQIGMKLIELQPGFARATLPITDETVNIYQMAHGAFLHGLSAIWFHMGTWDFGLSFLPPSSSQSLLGSKGNGTKATHSNS